MASEKIHVEITDQSICVRLDISKDHPRARFYWLAFFILLTFLAMCALLFLPGKHNEPSMWHDVTSVAYPESIFRLLLVLVFPLLMFFTMRRYVLAAYPSDELLACDPSTLTLARIRWFDIHNKHWESRSYPLTGIRDIRYRSVGSLRGTSIYGLRFTADGEKQRVLPGLKAREAERILKAIKAFGADVPDDPRLAKKLKEQALWS